jgi:hypothetical protein
MITIAAPTPTEGTSVRVATPRWIAAVALLTTAASTVVGAVPASADTAGPHYDVESSFNAYTDSASPDDTTYFPSGGLAPVGTSVDENGVTHTSRAYAGFDISGMNDSRLQRAVVTVPDELGSDCTAARDLTVRRTAAFDGNDWANPPATQGAAVAVTPSDACQPVTPTADVTTMLDRALTKHETKLWIEIRVPQRHEAIKRFARTLSFNDVRLQVTLTNQAPDKPTKLGLNTSDQPCTDNFATNSDFNVFANMSDRDRNPGDVLTPEMEMWPTSDPSAVTPVDTGIQSGFDGLFGSGYIHGKTLPDGRYGWHARTYDQRAYGPWSDPCYFTIDHVAPATAPTVASPDYPENSPTPIGGTFDYGTFLFTANGSADVVAFAYGMDGFQSARIDADQPGGAAVVSWYPTSSGHHSLTVWSVDAAGNRSQPRNYALNVA